MQKDIFQRMASAGFRTFLALLALTCCMRSGASVRLDIPREPMGPGISNDFTGLSFEMSYVLPDARGRHFFRPGNEALVAMFHTLGVRVLRVGGNTADRATLPLPSREDVDSLFDFAAAAKVRVLFTLRLKTSNPEWASEMAGYIMKHHGAQVEALAIGNEPNVYYKTFGAYLAQWRPVAEFVMQSNGHDYPGLKLAAPGTSPGHEFWARDMAATFGRHGLVSLISQHDYPGGDARRATNAPAARDRLLSPAMDLHYAKFAAGWVPTVLSNGLPYRLEEANSFYDGGAKDVSDTFASALWGLDYQWWWAAHGCGGVNFHTGDKVAARDENKPCRYAVFWTAPDGYQVHPLAYALKMFSLAGPGHLLATRISNEDGLNICAYALISPEGAITVTLINREHGPNGRPAPFILNPALPDSSASCLELTALGNSVEAEDGILLGGSSIGTDGSWNGHWKAMPRQAESGTYHLTLPPASAVLVKITPAGR